MDKVTAGSMRWQLAGSGVWVQVAEIFKTGQKIQNLHASGKDEACRARLSEKRKGGVHRGVGQGG
jgi:hypothetical protein